MPEHNATSHQVQQTFLTLICSADPSCQLLCLFSASLVIFPNSPQELPRNPPLLKLVKQIAGRKPMHFFQRRWIQTAVAGALFLAGIAVGSIATRNVSALNKFGQPKTVVHVVAYKFKASTSLNDQQQALDGIKDMAAKIPGIKNIWLKTERNQIRDFSGVYIIEFTSAEAAADYAESPIHDVWRKKWEQLRENSLSFQISN
jgi:hypothetical protein